MRPVVSALLLQACYTHNGFVYHMEVDPPQSPTQPERVEERSDLQPWPDPITSTPPSGLEQTPLPSFSKPSELRTQHTTQDKEPALACQQRELSSKPIALPKDKYATVVYAGRKGERITFYRDHKKWLARIECDLPGDNTQVKVLPVFAKTGVDIASYLNALSQQPASVQARRISVLATSQQDGPNQCVYLGKQGLQGGVDSFSIDGSKVRSDSNLVRMNDTYNMLVQILGSYGADNFCDSVETIFLLLNADDGPMYKDTFTELLNDLWNPLQVSQGLYAAIPFYLEKLNDVPSSKRPQVIANVIARFLKSRGKLGMGSIKLSKTSCASLCEALQGFATTMGNMNPVDAQVSQALIEEALSDVSSMELVELKAQQEAEAKRQAEIRKREKETEAMELDRLRARQEAEDRIQAEWQKQQEEARRQAEWKRQQAQVQAKQQQIQWEKEQTMSMKLSSKAMNVKDMDISDKGLGFIAKHEGLSLKIYPDPNGYDTIGYGHKILDGENFENGITEEEAAALFKKDAAEKINSIKKCVKVPLYQHQFDALVSYVYNVGEGHSVVGTRFIKKLNAGDYEGAAKEIDAGSKGPRALRGIIKRRAQERKLFLTGHY